MFVALIHALPPVGVASAARVAQLHGITVGDPNLEILLRPRAVLFELLAVFLAYAAFHRPLHGMALAGASIGVVAFLAQAVCVRA